MQRTLLAFIGLISLGPTVAHAGPLKPDGWEVRQSRFSCQLLRNVHEHGRAVFETGAGEPAVFYYSPQHVYIRALSASLHARAPVWAEQPVFVELGRVPLNDGANGLQLDAGFSERILSELFYGRDVVLQLEAQMPSFQVGELTIAAVGFRPAYRQYRQCLAGLLPVNFSQVERTAVYFELNEMGHLDPAELDKLDDVILYAKSDGRIRRIYVDGHTDNQGFRKDNLVVAQKRTEAVVDYLLSQGVPKDLIVSRWHGERYPAAPNNTAAGRAKNRRVTIRLEKKPAVDPVVHRQSSRKDPADS